MPGKNIRPLAGRPLLTHAVGIARNCRRVSRVVFSTDSAEYAAIAREAGAEAPFLRPAELATDTAIDLSYVRHALEWLDANERYRPDLVARLCPTAPLIRPADIDRCIELLEQDTEAESAIIMTESKEHPRKAVRLTSDGAYVVSYITETGLDVAPSNRQGYVEAFNRQGLPVVSRRRTVMERNSQTGDRVRFVQVPQETAWDVDSALDFRIVEMIMQGHA